MYRTRLHVEVRCGSCGLQGSRLPHDPLPLHDREVQPVALRELRHRALDLGPARSSPHGWRLLESSTRVRRHKAARSSL